MTENEVTGPGKDFRENGTDGVNTLPCLTAYFYRVIQKDPPGMERAYTYSANA